MVDQRVSLRDYVRGFSNPFWAANISELFERIAYYGMAPVLVPYLVNVRHFDESSAIRFGGNFGFIVYGLLVAGYLGVWHAPSFPTVVATLTLIAFGASIIKPAIMGTVQMYAARDARA